ncbi:hypothetical protein BO70DRAFT_366707 [Aspergillus heteromorphus CBS 117.55]|uniref:Uncharacterized protein n=1 Tax=Aspergillus heteromorphus CBS 117.55 TaxID=1448321 RepID=A0A317UYL2_9EURO|nr:uncharacterized protein BO70DRAFT_366707 [Aspergillus heteromorphus CBS 117.55]PWY65582.1 hypothetical protein BO70DRAFT_366707 [Aspergillus heteromorphus CBS 117.55]
MGWDGKRVSEALVARNGFLREYVSMMLADWGQLSWFQVFVVPVAGAGVGVGVGDRDLGRRDSVFHALFTG